MFTIDADLADWMEQRHEVPMAEEDYPHQGAPRHDAVFVSALRSLRHQY
jgi:hypothetical protein